MNRRATSSKGISVRIVERHVFVIIADFAYRAKPLALFKDGDVWVAHKIHCRNGFYHAEVTLCFAFDFAYGTLSNRIHKLVDGFLDC